MDHKTIAITRPVGKGSDTAELVKSLGWTPFIFHTVELKPFSDQKIMEQIRSSLTQGQLDWIVFMSPTGVKLLPEEYSSAGVDEWFSHLDCKDLRVVLVRSSSADASLANFLTSKGATVETVNIYDSGMPTDSQSVFDFLEGLRLGRFAAVLFTSAVSVSNFFRIAETEFESAEIVRRLKRVTVGAIGPVTAEQLRKMGIEPAVPDVYLMKNAVARLISARGPVQAL